MSINLIGGQISNNQYNRLLQNNQLFPEKGHYPIANSFPGASAKQMAFIGSRDEGFKAFLQGMPLEMRMDYINQYFPDSRLENTPPNLNTSASTLSAAQSAFVSARSPEFQKWFNGMNPQEQKNYMAQSLPHIPSNQTSANNTSGNVFSDVLNLAFTATKGLFNGIGAFFSGLFGSK